MERFHEDDIAVVKSGLFVRLLKYARPYWRALLLAVCAMVIATVLDLIRPYLLKVAVDDYITGYEKPMILTEADDYDLLFRGQKYLYVDPSENQSETYNLLVEGNEYYFGKTDSPKEKRTQIEESEYRMFRKKDYEGITKIAFFFLLTVFAVFLFAFLQEYILSVTSQKIIFNIRKDLFEHIESRAITYFDHNPIGRLVTRVTNDVENLNEMYTSVLVSSFSDFFIITGIIIVMFSVNVKLALLSLAVVPLIVLATMIFQRAIRPVYRENKAQLGKINAGLNENITGMKVIQMFKQENSIYRRFDEINQAYLKTSKDSISIHGIFRPSIEILKSCATATLIYFGGRYVLKQEIPFGVLYLFTSYVGKFFRPILDLSEKFNILQSALSSSERIFTILDDDTEILNPTNPVALEKVLGKIEFRNVWFAYEEENWVLRDVNFIIQPGEAVAFVGATGAGKSSIMSLILRFYDCQKGEILLDDVNIRDLDKYELRRNIGVVLQDVFLFTGTIEENIRLQDENISTEKVQEVAKYVNADPFIQRLPKGYQEPVMERGSTLSNGQRQLLSFARTLAFDPKILILDEATSNIDTETELLIQDALGKLIRGRTSIAVAHRLSTIQHSDKIIVLHKGKIVEEGNHSELLSKKGLYYDLYRLQYKDSFEEGA